MKRSGFDRDAGNGSKCGKHGVSREDASRMLCLVFLVFMVRELDSRTLLRPISARYMHQKEMDHHEQPCQTDAELRH